MLPITAAPTQRSNSNLDVSVSFLRTGNGADSERCVRNRTAEFGALVAALFAWGAFQGALDVSMNTQAVTVERAAGRPLISGFHGSWSIGAFAGAGIGALGVAARISLAPQLLLLAVPVLAVTGPLSLRMLPDPRTPGDAAPVGRVVVRLSGAVLVLGSIAGASTAQRRWRSHSSRPRRCPARLRSHCRGDRPGPG